jgi:phage-related protein
VAKRIADETFQISFRIDKEKLDKVDAFRERIGAAVGTPPQRSDIMRAICDLGIEAFEKNNKVLSPRGKKKRTVKKRVKKPAVQDAASP